MQQREAMHFHLIVNDRAIYIADFFGSAVWQQLAHKLVHESQPLAGSAVRENLEQIEESLLEKRLLLVVR